MLISAYSSKEGGSDFRAQLYSYAENSVTKQYKDPWL